MNDHNLKSLATRTTSEQREIAQKGGIASGVSRREKKLFKEVVATLLSGNVEDASTRRRLLEEMGIANPTKYEQVLLALYDKAAGGNVKAIHELIELNDGKPTQKVDLQTTDGHPVFMGFSSVLPDINGIEEMVMRIDREREKQLAEINGE